MTCIGREGSVDAAWGETLELVSVAADTAAAAEVAWVWWRQPAHLRVGRFVVVQRAGNAGWVELGAAPTEHPERRRRHRRCMCFYAASSCLSLVALSIGASGNLAATSGFLLLRYWTLGCGKTATRRNAKLYAKYVKTLGQHPGFWTYQFLDDSWKITLNVSPYRIK